MAGMCCSGAFIGVISIVDELYRYISHSQTTYYQADCVSDEIMDIQIIYDAMVGIWYAMVGLR